MQGCSSRRMSGECRLLQTRRCIQLSLTANRAHDYVTAFTVHHVRDGITLRFPRPSHSDSHVHLISPGHRPALLKPVRCRLIKSNGWSRLP